MARFIACYHCLLPLLVTIACYHCLLPLLVTIACYHCLLPLLITIAYCGAVQCLLPLLIVARFIAWYHCLLPLLICTVFGGVFIPYRYCYMACVFSLLFCTAWVAHFIAYQYGFRWRFLLLISTAWDLSWQKLLFYHLFRLSHTKSDTVWKKFFPIIFIDSRIQKWHCIKKIVNYHFYVHLHFRILSHVFQKIIPHHLARIRPTLYIIVPTRHFPLKACLVLFNLITY